MRSQAREAARAAIPQTLAGKAVVVTGAVPGSPATKRPEAITTARRDEPGQRGEEDVRVGRRRRRRGVEAHQGGAHGIPIVPAERFDELLATGELPD